MRYIYIITISVIFGFNSYLNSQCDIKTNNRPDGSTIKYFKPKPIIRNSNYEVGVSIYKNENTNDYLLNVSVLFIKMSPKKLVGDLVIQTANSKGIRLKQLLNKQITMNGRKLANAMYTIENGDFYELKNYYLQSLFFNLDDSLEGSNITENNKVLMKQLKCLPKENKFNIKPYSNSKNNKIEPTQTITNNGRNNNTEISYSQNFIYLGKDRYNATNNWTFKAYSGFGTKDNPELAIAKNGESGYAMLAAYVGKNENMINGDLIIYLKNGVSIRCVDRGIKDFVDGKSVCIYKLTSNEMRDLRNNLISKIRYNINYRQSGDFFQTAENKVPINSFNIVKNSNEPDYYLTRNEVNRLFIKNFNGQYTSNKTIFKNELNPKQNFTEETTFNLNIAFESKDDGLIVIQDPRIASRPLFYKITGFKEEFESKGNDITVYRSVNQINQKDSEVVFFENENGLKLMISDGDSLQIWLNLKLTNNE